MTSSTGQTILLLFDQCEASSHVLSAYHSDWEQRADLHTHISCLWSISVQTLLPSDYSVFTVFIHLKLSSFASLSYTKPVSSKKDERWQRVQVTRLGHMPDLSVKEEKRNLTPQSIQSLHNYFTRNVREIFCLMLQIMLWIFLCLKKAHSAWERAVLNWMET